MTHENAEIHISERRWRIREILQRSLKLLDLDGHGLLWWRQRGLFSALPLDKYQQAQPQELSIWAPTKPVKVSFVFEHFEGTKSRGTDRKSVEDHAAKHRLAWVQ